MPMAEQSLTTSSHESSEVSTQAEKTWHITIEMIPEDTLLEIFDFYQLDAMKNSYRKPWKWQCLAHVCRKWRHVVSVSPRRLGLKIHCQSKASIESILATWPSFPLVVRFKHPNRRFLPRNLIIALRHPNRICDIDLMMPNSIIGPIVEVIQEPIPELERIQITSRNRKEIPVLSTLLGGSSPRLKNINLQGIVVPFPVLRQLLFSTINLTTLRLHNITTAGYFSPDALVTVLLHPALARLERLDVHFHLAAFPTTSSMACPPPLTHATLSSLTSLCYRGTTDYLEEFVAKIDAPALTNIRIKFYNQLIFNIPETCRFLSRMDRLKFLHGVVVKPTIGSISLCLRERRRLCWECELGIICGQLDWKLSSIAQILHQLSPLLPEVTKFDINTYPSMPTCEDVDSIQWLELFQPFPHLSSVSAVEQFVPNIAHALVTEDMATEALPALRMLILRGYRKLPSVAEAAKKFCAMRELSGGHKVSLYG